MQAVAQSSGAARSHRPGSGVCRSDAPVVVRRSLRPDKITRRRRGRQPALFPGGGCFPGHRGGPLRRSGFGLAQDGRFRSDHRGGRYPFGCPCDRGSSQYEQRRQLKAGAGGVPALAERNERPDDHPEHGAADRHHSAPGLSGRGRGSCLLRRRRPVARRRGSPDRSRQGCFQAVNAGILAVVHRRAWRSTTPIRPSRAMAAMAGFAWRCPVRRSG